MGLELRGLPKVVFEYKRSAWNALRVVGSRKWTPTDSALRRRVGATGFELLKTRSHAVATTLAFKGNMGVMSSFTRDRALWALRGLPDLATSSPITNDGCDRVRRRKKTRGRTHVRLP